LSAGRVLAAQTTIPDPGTYVVDQANVIDANTRRQMEGWLRELEQKTGAQVKVLTVATTGGEDFLGFVQRHAEAWKLGRAGKDNGVLIAVAVADRQARIHPGYGLEAVLPDSWCGSLHRNVFVNNFRGGQFSTGIFQGTVAVANRIADDAKIQLTGIPDFRHRRSTAPVAAVGGGFSTLFVLMIVLIVLSRRRRCYGRWGGGFGGGLFWGSVMSNVLRGGRGFGGGFRGGFGGGGFGGFGGSFGGGGRFGGGGGGGSW